MQSENNPYFAPNEIWEIIVRFCINPIPSGVVMEAPKERKLEPFDYFLASVSKEAVLQFLQLRVVCKFWKKIIDNYREFWWSRAFALLPLFLPLNWTCLSNTFYCRHYWDKSLYPSTRHFVCQECYEAIANSLLEPKKQYILKTKEWTNTMKNQLPVLQVTNSHIFEFSNPQPLLNLSSKHHLRLSPFFTFVYWKDKYFLQEIESQIDKLKKEAGKLERKLLRKRIKYTKETQFVSTVSGMKSQDITLNALNERIEALKKRYPQLRDPYWKEFVRLNCLLKPSQAEKEQKEREMKFVQKKIELCFDFFFS